MSKKSKRKPNMQRQTSQKQQAQVQVHAQSSGGGGGGTQNTTYYVHGPRGIHSQQKNGEWKWMAEDGLGSVRSVVDDTAAVHQSIVYDPFGNPIDVAGPEQTMFGYTGEPTDLNGLVYLRNRYYSPQLGTFISQDPTEGSMKDPMSLNQYAYVQGNPVNHTDPSGLSPVNVSGMNHLMQNNPLAFAQMMNTGMCLQTDPCAGYAGAAYTLCRQGLTPTPTITPFPGTPMPSTHHVPCSFATPFLNVRRDPSLLASIVNIVNNPAGVEFQLSSHIPGDTQLGGTGWWYANSLGGWVHDSNLSMGPSPCPKNPNLTTPTPSAITPTPTPGISDLDTISRVINCEAAGMGVSAYGIAHSIYNRMTSGAAEWEKYRTALSIIQNTGVDCYPNAYRSYRTSNESNQAAQWLLGMGSAPPVNAHIDLRAYYWLGVPTPPDLTNLENTFVYIVDNPSLYNYSACGVNETRETRLQRLRDRLVGIDPSSGDLTTIYFSLNPLCEQ